MMIKLFKRGGTMLVLWTALASDLHHRSEDEKLGRPPTTTWAWLMPVIKGVLTGPGLRHRDSNT